MSENTDQPKPEYISPDFDKLSSQMEEEGFEFVDQEYLTQTKFSSEAKFESVPLQSVNEIKKKYSQNGENEVRLVLKLTPDMERLLKEDPTVTLTRIPDRFKSYLVFTKKG